MEAAPKALEAFGALQRRLAEAAMQAVDSTVHTPWREFCLDIRSTPDGEALDVRFYVVPVSGAPISVPMPQPVAAIVHETWQMRSACFSPPWYGMKLSITSEGQCKINFNYDPNCNAEPTISNN